jgi:mitotic spindle assembly checkpoint protein MAD2
MSSTATQAANEITLRGSTAIVTEFFGYSINSILYQRGIYPPETFSRVQEYGLSMLVTQDKGLQEYLSKILSQVSQWLVGGEVQKLVIVVTGAETGESLERWTFNVETDQGAVAGTSAPAEKSTKVIKGEIQAIIRQITASVSFLPLLNEPCTFDLLVYTDSEAAVPNSWEESDPKYIANSQEVRLRSFTTKVHKVDAMVSYKAEEDEDI